MKKTGDENVTDKCSSRSLLLQEYIDAILQAYSGVPDDEALQPMTLTLDKNMHNSSGSPSTDAHRVALRAFVAHRHRGADE